MVFMISFALVMTLDCSIWRFIASVTCEILVDKASCLEYNSLMNLGFLRALVMYFDIAPMLILWRLDTSM